MLLGIVTVALLKLSLNRSNRDIRAADNAQTAKQGGDDSGSGGDGGGGGPPVVEIVVIMAGDENPTHLAKPVPSPSTGQ